MENIAKLQEKQNCRSCGGQIQFSPEDRALVCVNCNARSEAESTADETVATLTCPSCSGALPDTTGLKQVKCDYCGNSFSVLQEGSDCPNVGSIPEDHKLIIPFHYNKDACKEGLIHWFAQNAKGAPGDLFEKMAFIRELEGYYIPHYVCVASYTTSYTASIGYDRVETYTVHERQRDRNGNSRTVPVTKTRIVTDWFPHSGNVAGRVSNAFSATKHLADMHYTVNQANGPQHFRGNDEHVNKHLADAIPINSASGKPVAEAFSTNYTAGFHVLPYVFPAEASYNRNLVSRHIMDTIKQSAPGDHIRDISLSNCNIIPDYYLVYCPTWCSVYSYEDCAFATHSIGPESRLHFASYPLDSTLKKKTRLAVLPFKISIVSAILALMLFGIMKFFMGGAPDALFVITLGLFAFAAVTGIIGGIVRAVLYRKRKGSLKEASASYLENPSKLFGRKSSKADPLNT